MIFYTYVRSEGFCVLVVKPLSKAIADGDPIRAIVKATGTNQVISNDIRIDK